MLCLTLAPALAAAETRLPVYVKGAAATNGWTDPSGERDDSARDLTRHLQSADRKHVHHVRAEAEAAIILEVLDRRIEYRTLVLTVRVRAGEYQTEMSSRDDRGLGSWRNCARKIVQQLDAWALANREQFVARR